MRVGFDRQAASRTKVYQFLNEVSGRSAVGDPLGIGQREVPPLGDPLGIGQREVPPLG
ncbi:MAG: hypothetical protein JO031_17965 [Ktedonobacteraceae bacterium]|nr:hypothetical protein [Ktedonobacteraceae bacterium]